MPWKENDAVDQRMRFVADYLREEFSFAELCALYGISRPTGYKWVRRYLKGGVEALQDRSRAPCLHPNATRGPIVELVLETRRTHPTWGPRKLLPWLQRRYPGLELPSSNTMGNIIRRHGLSVPRRRRRPLPGPPSALGSQDAANASWSIDFKGQFRLRCGAYCYPLTLMDGCCRYLLRCQALRRTRAKEVQPVLTAAFREFGLPKAIRSDNGSPFASNGFTGLSQLSVWWVQLGIRLDRTRPGSPQDNGRLERFHRTLKQEVCQPRARGWEAQQEAFHKFRLEYNNERPHEALGTYTPGSRYEPSNRLFPRKLPTPEYPVESQVRPVASTGVTNFAGWLCRTSEALAGERIAFLEVEDGVYDVRFHAHRLYQFDARTGQADNGTVTRQCRRSRP